MTDNLSLGSQGQGLPVAAPVIAGYYAVTNPTAGALNSYFVPISLVASYQNATVSLEGTWSATLTFYGGEVADITRMVTIPAIRRSDGVSSPTAVANGIYTADITGIKYFAVRVTTYASGTVTGEATFGMGVPSAAAGGFAEHVIVDSGHIITDAGSVTTASYADVSVTGSITAADVASTTVTGFDGCLITTGAATAGSTVSTALVGQSSVALQLAGTWSQTIVAEKSNDGGTTWVQSSGHVLGTGFDASTLTGNCTVVFNTAGSTNFRVRATAVVSGTANVTTVKSVLSAFQYVAAITQGNAASLAADSGNPVKTGYKYNLVAPVATDGQRVDSQGDINGNLKDVEQYAPLYEDNTPTGRCAAVQAIPTASATYTLSIYLESASVTKANIKATPGSVYRMYFTNANAAVRYLQIHNKATIPAAADTALDFYLIPAGTATAPGTLSLEFRIPVYCSAGIGWAVSTTATTFTDSATAADHMFNLKYF